MSVDGKGGNKHKHGSRKGGMIGGGDDDGRCSGDGDSDGEGRVFVTHGPGYVFGEVGLVFPALRSCIVRSVTDTKLLCFGQETLKRVQLESPRDYQTLMRSVEVCCA